MSCRHRCLRHLRSRLLPGLALLSLLAGCVAPESARPRFFWPFPPEEPRIEFIQSYQADHDLRRRETWLTQVLLGREHPRSLFQQPYDVVSDPARGRVLVSDIALRSVVILDLQQGRFELPRPRRVRTELQVATPFALALDGGGRLFVSDMGGGKIVRHDSGLEPQLAMGLGILGRVAGLTVDAERQRLLAADVSNNCIQLFSLDGAYLGRWGTRGTGAGEFNFPLDVEVAADGEVFVLDALNFRVQVFGPEGEFRRSFGVASLAAGGFQLPKGLALDRSGQVYVTDSRAHRIQVFDRQGRFLTSVGGYGAVVEHSYSPGGLNLPGGIDADANDTIWVVDVLNRMLHRFQFLNADYLRAHPIEADEVYRPRPEDLSGGR